MPASTAISIRCRSTGCAPSRTGCLRLLRGKHADILDSIRTSRDLTDDTAAKLKGVVEAYAKSFS